VTKLTEVTLLSAENDSLRARETVLQSFVDDSTLAAQLLEEEEAREEAERAAAERAVDLALSTVHYNLAGRGAAAAPPANAACAGGKSGGPDPSSGSGSQGRSGSQGGSGSQGRSSGDAAAAGRPGVAGMGGSGFSRSVLEVAAGELAPEDFVAAFVPRYIAHIQDARRRRLRPDGTVVPLPAGDARRRDYAWLLDVGCMQQPSGMSYAMFSFNLETGRRAAPPDGLASRAGRALRLRWVQWVRVGGG
jgi:hypothetical protein